MFAATRGSLLSNFTFFRHLSRSLMADTTSRVFASFSTGSPHNASLKRVGTHNKSFHCDEALGCFMIRLTDKFSNAEVFGTRDPQVLDGLDAVLDVGGMYDPSRDRYDHHQKGFEEVFGHGFSTKLSSAGLLYKAIDAIDNGINQYDIDQPPKYVNNTHLSSRVGRLNLDWTEPDHSPEKENEAFQQAMALAGSEFLDWKLHLFELEEEMKIDPPIKYALYQDERSKH